MPTAFERLQAQRDEARDLASALKDVIREFADFQTVGEEFPDLAYDRLPGWLTDEDDAPETWQRIPGGGQ